MRKNLRFLKNIFLSRLRRNPYKLNFAVTAACNSRCLTCNVGRLFQKNPEIIKKELTTQEIANLFESLPSTITWFSFSGGEPFLRRDFLKIVSLAIQKIPSLSVISIPSNGLNTESIIKIVRQILKLDHLPQLFINFSLDGPPEIHNKIRGVEGGYEKTWRTYQSIKKLSKINNNLRVNLEVTVSGLNIDYLADFCKKLVETREKITITIAHQGSLYKNEDNGSILLSGKTLQEVKKITHIIDKSQSWFSPPELVEKLYLRKIVRYIENPNKQILPCVALFTSCALDSQGKLTPCFMWGENLGNIKDNDFMEIWRSPKAFQARKLIQSNGCPNCWTPCEAYQSIIWTFLTGRWDRL